MKFSATSIIFSVLSDVQEMESSDRDKNRIYLINFVKYLLSKYSENLTAEINITEEQDLFNKEMGYIK